MQRMLALALTALFLLTTPAHASLVTLDFNVEPDVFLETPYLEDGFRLTPNCHYDISDSGGITWFGFDSIGCLDLPPMVRLEREDGGRFDLLSLLIVESFASLSATSSAGAVEMLDGCLGEFTCPKTFAGPGWRNLTYVDFEIVVDAGDPQGFDDIELLAVAEPGYFALLGLGLVLAYGSRIRVRRL